MPQPFYKCTCPHTIKNTIILSVRPGSRIQRWGGGGGGGGDGGDGGGGGDGGVVVVVMVGWGWWW